MIARLGALLLLLYVVGFVLFAFTLGEPAGPAAPATDAAVVLTGGPGRLQHGIDALTGHKAQRLLVAGTDPSVRMADITRRFPASRHWLSCCVDLGTESVDTRTHAEEAKRWLDKHGYKSLRLITSDWHMRRARYEFRRVLGGKYRVVPDAVETEPSFITLFGEYNKYLLRRVAVWAGL